MRRFRVLIVAGLFAVLALGGTACSPTPPPASDVVGTAVYNAGVQLLNTILNDLFCNGQPFFSCIYNQLGHPTL